MKSHKSSSLDETERVTDQSARFNGAMADAVERGVSIFGNSMRAFQRESMRFLTRRMEENARAVQEMGACKSFPDLLVTQQRWIAEMTRAYSEEWARYGDLVTEVIQETEKATEDSIPARRGETH